jgi:hypothetical protein
VLASDFHCIVPCVALLCSSSQATKEAKGKSLGFFAHFTTLREIKKAQCENKVQVCDATKLNYELQLSTNYFSNKPSAFHCLKTLIVLSLNLALLKGIKPFSPGCNWIRVTISSMLLLTAV